MKLIRYVPSVVWMGTIFYLSHQPANKSAETSLGVVDFALNIFQFQKHMKKNSMRLLENQHISLHMLF